MQPYLPNYPYPVYPPGRRVGVPYIPAPAQPMIQPTARRGTQSPPRRDLNFDRWNTSGKKILFPDRLFHEEGIVKMGPAKKLAHGLRETFVELPKSVWQGLTGSPEYNFNDFLRVAKIPYYLGGAFLTMLFIAGGDKVTALRQGIGVLMYYLSVMAANRAVDGAVKAKYGVDLGMKFRKYNGEIENVFTSPVFSRYDLISEKDYAKMREKMGIPDNVADPEGQVQKVIQDIIPAARTGKILLGTVVAAFAAGYLARSDGWARLFGIDKTLKETLKAPGVNPAKRLLNAGSVILGGIRDVLKEKFSGGAAEKLYGKSPWLRRGALGLVGGAILYTLWQLTRMAPKKEYERPGFSGGFTHNEQSAYGGTGFNGMGFRSNDSVYGSFLNARRES